MAPRVQGVLTPDGNLELSLWGAGRVANIRLAPAGGPALYGPNQVTTDPVSFAAAQSAPAVAVRGGRLLGVTPAKKRAVWDRREHARPHVSRKAGRLHIRLGWARLVIEERDGDLLIAAGANDTEARRGLSLSVGAVLAEAAAHAARCDRMPEADPLLRSMVQQGVHAALASIRRDAQGAFCGLAAGLAYSAPARTYYRDGYWTAQALLDLAPQIVAEQIDLLARGLQPDGEAPSGVIVEHRRSHAPRAHDWWSDHFDSPLFFVLLLDDYVAATGDAAVTERHWPAVRTIVERYDRLSGEAGLPLKPRHDRDWADNVYRSGLVAYDLGLWVGALRAAARLGRALDPSFATQCRKRAEAAGPAIVDALWTGRWLADYAPPDAAAETHLTLDSLTLLRSGAVTGDKALALLAAVRQKLESRHNDAQPWGDWGMLCAYPPYARAGDVRAKSAFGFRYHNGADWPWLDGLYADERLKRGLPGWRYPLLRWWEVSLAQGWAGPVEYFSPPYPRGGLLQGWSSLPAAVALRHRNQVLAGDADG
jgi:hypothetical protein